MNADRLILFFAAPLIVAARVANAAAQALPVAVREVRQAWDSFACPQKCPEEAEPTTAVSSVPVRTDVRKSVDCACCAYSGPDDGRDCTCVEGCPEG